MHRHSFVKQKFQKYYTDCALLANPTGREEGRGRYGVDESKRVSGQILLILTITTVASLIFCYFYNNIENRRWARPEPFKFCRPYSTILSQFYPIRLVMMMITRIIKAFCRLEAYWYPAYYNFVVALHSRAKTKCGACTSSESEASFKPCCIDVKATGINKSLHSMAIVFLPAFISKYGMLPIIRHWVRINKAFDPKWHRKLTCHTH